MMKEAVYVQARVQIRMLFVSEGCCHSSTICFRWRLTSRLSKHNPSITKLNQTMSVIKYLKRSH